MSDKLLEIRGLRASSGEKEILHGIDLTIGKGETHVIMGPNGAGKSTLTSLIMGDPSYSATEGSVLFRGEDLLSLRADERARKGIFLSFQDPVEIPGVTLEDFLRTAYEQVNGTQERVWEFHKRLVGVMDMLSMDHSYASRELNAGFSGGEKKKSEILQMLLLRPALAMLDETDSGLDVDAVNTVSGGIMEFQKDAEASLLIITHNASILNSLKVDHVHILSGGKIVADGGADLVEEITARGFSTYLEAGNE